MSTAVELLRQILAAPDDDQLRLVYADVLQAAGDPRGELVALDLELAHAPRPALRARRAELLRTYGRTWWPAIPVEYLDIRRGFVERAAGTWRQLDAAAAMFESEPIARVEICEARDPFVDAPWQRHLRELAVRGSLGGQGLVALGASALGDQLAVLDVGHADLATFPELGDAFPRLRAFGVADNPMLRHDLHQLATWHQLPALDLLDLRRCRLDTELLLPIVAALARVRELRLSGNPIGPDGVFVLARTLAGLPALARLELIGTGVGVDGVRALEAALPTTQIVVDLPASVTLDLVGRELVITHHAGALWGITLDGAPQRVEITHAVQYAGHRGPSVTHGDSGRHVPLDELVRAVASGAVRTLEGTHVRIQRSMSSGAVTNTSVWSRETVKLAISAHAIEVTFEEAIDTSS